MNNLNLITESLTDGYKTNFLDLLSLVAIFLGVSVIISKNPIVSVLFLISLFCVIASYLIILGMHFIGLSYLLVYVGAISILFLFILMLINVRVSELITDTNNSIPLAILTGLAFTIPVYSILPPNINMFDIINMNSIYNILNIFNNDILSITLKNAVTNEDLFTKTGFVTSKMWDGTLLETSHITSIGNILYTNIFIWLIVTSLILLLAMVGAIVITVKASSKDRR